MFLLNRIIERDEIINNGCRILLVREVCEKMTFVHRNSRARQRDGVVMLTGEKYRAALLVSA